MALVQSLAMSGAGNRLLRDEMDSKEMVMARGMSYILFYAIFGNLVRWSYGFSLLVPRDEDERGQGKGAVEEKGLEGRRMSAREGEVCIEIERGIRDASSSLSTTDNNPQTLHTHNPSPSSTLNPSGTTPTTFKQKFTIFFDKLCQVLTPPLMTALIALVIGLVPALHQFFMSPESKFYTFVIHPLEECGEGAIPLILLCLGAQVVHLTASSSSPDLDTASPPSPAVESASGKSKQVGRSSSIQPDNGMSPLDAIAEEDEKVRQEHDRLSVKRIEDGTDDVFRSQP
ncbi:hypothetical protein EC991_002655 [Linnemannia zychae]|nr:hypothetical protein EC991_002655 [Linnemannia zychae]